MFDQFSDDEAGRFHRKANDEARAHFLERCGGLHVVLLDGDAATLANTKVQTLLAQHARGDVFAVELAGTLAVPRFQFAPDGSTPHPCISRILDVLHEDYTAWSMAIWWISSNPWLDDHAPLDLWPQEAERIVWAAETEQKFHRFAG